MLYLEMLKIFFPAGLDIATTQQTQDHAKAHDLLGPGTPDRTSVLLVTRVFSLVPVKSELSKEDFSLDFDLSQFSSYVATLKFLMQSVFQSIMYRMFRMGRADMGLFREAQGHQGFKRQGNHMFGYVFKAALAAGEGTRAFKEPWTVGLMSAEEYRAALKEACQVWNYVFNIHTITESRSASTKELSAHFEAAQTFLVAKLRAMGERDLAASVEAKTLL
jgi:hypothetical protein